MRDSGSGLRDRWARCGPAGYSAVLALLIVGPLLGPGYLLLRDAVSTPRSYSTDSALGLGDAAPRAVPQDAMLAVLSPIIDGGLIVKAILVAALWAAGYGAAVLSRELLRVPVGAQLVAVTVALWNPYVAERLLQGHWSLLTGYAALPWTALAAYRIRATTGVAAGAAARNRQGASGAAAGSAPDRARWWSWLVSSSAAARVGAWAALAGCFAAAGLTPTGAILVGCTALALVGWRNLVWTLVLWVAAAAPWLTATALSGAGADPSDPAGVVAFAARAEPGLGTLGALAGLGGIWNGDAVPQSRTTLLAPAGTCLLLMLVAIGVRAVAADRGSRSDRAADEHRPPLPKHHRRWENRWHSHSDHPDTEAVHGSGDRLRVRRTLLIIAAAAVLLTALGATAWGITIGEWLVTQIPGAGLLRDTQKYVALAIPAYALCVAAGCTTVAARLAGKIGTATVQDVLDQSGRPDWATEENTESIAAVERPDRATPGAAWNATTTDGADHPEHTAPSAAMWLTTTVFVALLVLPMFDLAWGVRATVQPVRYPAGWQRVAEHIDGPGDVAVLPGGMFRMFRYSGPAPVLDPAPRMLPHDVLQTGELPVRGRTVSGEGARARDVETSLLHGGSAPDLASLDVGWVLVERTTPGPLGESASTLAHLDQVYADPDLALYRVPGTLADDNGLPPAHRRIAGAAHLLWAAILISGLLIAALGAAVPSRSETEHARRSDR